MSPEVSSVLANQRRRQAYSSPSLPTSSSSLTTSSSSPFTSSSVSGYSTSVTSPSSPEKSPVPKHTKPIPKLWSLVDGNLSDDDPFVDRVSSSAMAKLTISSAFQPTELTPPSQKQPNHATIPMRSRTSDSPRRRARRGLPLSFLSDTRPTLPSSFLSDTDTRIPRRSSEAGIVRSSPRSLRIPDRFVPTRSESADTIEKFRTGKSARHLTSPERMLRHGRATEDAFCYRRRDITPLAAAFRPPPNPEDSPSRNRVGTVLGLLDQNDHDRANRQVSHGNVWTVGGIAPGGTAVNNGLGQLIRSGTNARLFRTTFPTATAKPEEEIDKHEARLAVALNMDLTQRVLETNVIHHHTENARSKPRGVLTQWNGSEWVTEGTLPKPKQPLENRDLPIAPFKVLDAPGLRDNFYCSVLAYSCTSHTLAVGLGELLYGWSESEGVRLLMAGHVNSHFNSISFSSTDGGKSILAAGRNDGTLSLLSLNDDIPYSGASAPLPRFELRHSAPISCVSWRPKCTFRSSVNRINPGALVKTEDLLIGDEAGHVSYYSVEWPDRWEVERHNWSGQMTLLARISVHLQQVCGLSWSPNGDLFATGGNDNLCCLFETSKAVGNYGGYEGVAQEPYAHRFEDYIAWLQTENSQASPRTESAAREVSLPGYKAKHLKRGDDKHHWLHGAAVKAIAFCPWQEGLVATGGGSNDKCIHFFHTTTGAPLATISVSAQVTSLIWSTTKREIAATFGFALPDHPVRIAVFSWPDCRQVATIPWPGEHRALYAIPYPGDPKEPSDHARHCKSPSGRTRTLNEGCIMVASSEQSVKFHEIWPTDKKTTVGGVGMLGGSDILESLEGIDNDGDVIR